MTRPRTARVLALLALLVTTAPAALAAQGVVRRSAPAATSDSAGQDTAKKVSELVKWIEPDSVLASLLAREGFSKTRYQGRRVRFDATTRTLYLEGEPAAVLRGTALLVGDTILYNDSTRVVVARGDTVILRDPSQQSADVVALGVMTYNLEDRRGVVTNISTSVESGETWFMRGSRAAFVSDTAKGRQTIFYARDGTITSCDDEIPDYHFHAKEIKLVSKNLLVARPAVLYIGDVPVLWLPFIFQDMRSGRRSGLLTPRFGVSEIFRASPSYRRTVENLGYYMAISDYLDAQLSLDWRSGARPTPGDPGWLRWNGEWRYRWLDRFVTGRLAVSHLAQRDGTSNTAYSWAHQQDFSQTSHLTTNINYVTSTTVQRRTTFDPRQVLATIQSQASYQQQLGPAQFSIGGSQRQYPGREEISRDFPNFNVSVPTLALMPWLSWTPSLAVSNQEQLKVDQQGEFAFRYSTRNGLADSTRVQANARNTRLNFDTPFKIGEFTWQNSFRVSDQENDAPVTIAVVDPADPSKKLDRVFARTYSTEIDWQTAVNLPSLFQNSWRITPSVGIGNVDPAGFWVRTEQTGGEYVHQSKRLTYSVSAAPAFFGLFPGIGGYSRFRHSVSPVVSFGYSPAARVSDRFLRALNRTPTDYLGNLAQSAVTLQLSHNVEGKLRAADTSATEARKVKLLSMNFSPLTYDFERKRKTGRSGFTTENFGYDLTTDLLPGFRMRVDYSLFQGSVLSDTAVFRPFRTGIDASFSLNGESGILAAISRVFGRAVPQGTPQVERLETSDDDALAGRVAATPVAGSYTRNRQYSVPETKGGVQGTFTFSSTRQRPPTGSGQVINEDPRTRCQQFIVNPLEYDQCILVQQTNPQNATPIGRITQGGPFIRVPARETLASQASFNLTPMWSGSWGTIYDFQAGQFASHSVTLQRKLHDWRAIFAFSQAPNGNFAFNFFISLNAQPDLKFDYDRRSYRPPSR